MSFGILLHWAFEISVLVYFPSQIHSKWVYYYCTFSLKFTQNQFTLSLKLEPGTLYKKLSVDSMRSDKASAGMILTHEAWWVFILHRFDQWHQW